jgi:hypothetical protein
MGETLQSPTLTEQSAFKKISLNVDCESIPTSRRSPVKELTKDASREQSRCFACHKKLGVARLPIVCKCGAATCLKHKWPHHECGFDHRAAERKRLAELNPVVQCEKIDRI